MSRHKLDLVTREAFAALSLHEKNDYLQGVARRIQGLRGDDPEPLDRDSLSRLRRFYARRSFADLKREDIADERLRASLSRLAESIHLGEVRKAAAHEAPGTPRPLKREAPDEDGQLSFFIPVAHDAPVKDDMNLMDLAPFALSKASKGGGVLRYELKDVIVTVEGGADVGLATAWDYDIFVHMVSHLAAEMRDYQAAERKGRRPSLPNKTYRPAAADLLRFCRRDLGGKQYLDLERSLDRLLATRIKITNLSGGKRRETEAVTLIGGYRVTSRTAGDRIELVEIDIPAWVYDGVVRPDGKPTILTLSPDYFLISRPLAKFVYRLARKAAGDGEAWYRVDDLHYRSGSKLPAHKFRAALDEIVRAATRDPLPDYDLELREGERGPVLKMSRRKLPMAAANAKTGVHRSAKS